MPVEVRPARSEDLPSLTDLYNYYVLTSAATFDLDVFTVEARRAWYEEHASTGPYRLLVAAGDHGPNPMLGFASSSRFHDRRAYDTSVETSVYLQPDARGRGVGTALYARLFDLLGGQDLHRAYAGVVLPNDASLALHARFGFRPVGTYGEVGRKFGRYWDVRWLERELP